MTTADLLRAWVGRQAQPEALAWFDARRGELAAAPSTRALTIAFSLAGRRLGRAVLALDTADIAAAEAARPGWRAEGLTIDQAGRILLLIEAASALDDFPSALRTLSKTADVGEWIAILRGLPLYPQPEALLPVATEGVRFAMRPVFEAVAHANPYPAAHFPEGAWNQLVLKALFVDSVLHPIAGLDDRWNAALAATLFDYAHERWAAGRAISPELWRGVGPFADAAGVADLARVLAEGDPMSRIAAALALHQCPHPDAAAALAKAPELAAAAARGEISWNDVRPAAPQA